MLDLAWVRTRRAGACALSVMALSFVAAEVDAKPKKENATKKAKADDGPDYSGKKPGEPESDDIMMTTTKPDGTKIVVVELEEDPSLAAPPKPEQEAEPPQAYPLNWLGLSLQQDSLIYSSTPGVCVSVDSAGKRMPGVDQYSCRDSRGAITTPVYAGGGNRVNGGFGLATTRILLGYDRVLIHRLLAGARLGYAFREAPTVAGVAASMPLHVEARGAFYFLGARPFERPGIRPFGSFGLGLAEVDGVVAVDYYRDQAAYSERRSSRLHAWRRTGMGFVAPGGGASYAIGKVMINAEIKLLVLLPAFALAPSLTVGGAYGL
jgi:hypothetical protein